MPVVGSEVAEVAPPLTAVMSYGAVPLGAAAGGLVGRFAGVRTGLPLGVIGMVSTIAWILD